MTCFGTAEKTLIKWRYISFRKCNIANDSAIYQDDEEQIDPRSGGGDVMAMAQVVKMMLTKLDWYGTLFPRIPVPIQV